MARAGTIASIVPHVERRGAVSTAYRPDGPSVASSSIPARRLLITVVGDVKFGKGGGWSEARVLQVQYQNIKGADLSEFKDASTQAVVWPAGELPKPRSGRRQWHLTR
jgi:hypothetical protein